MLVYIILSEKLEQKELSALFTNHLNKNRVHALTKAQQAHLLYNLMKTLNFKKK